MPEIGRLEAHKISHQNNGSDEISVAGLSGALADAQTAVGHHVSHEVGGGDVVSIGAPSAHKTSHQNNGSDEISVAGLSGALGDAQTPSAHKTSHENGGSDEISVAGLSGALADAQTPSAHKTSHQNGGSDEISVAGLSGALADAQTPSAHKTSHEDGGADEIGCTGLVGRVNYVDRGDPSAPDFDIDDLTVDGAWHDLSLSSILPVGAVAAHIAAAFWGGDANLSFSFRKNGCSNIVNAFNVVSQVADVMISSDGFVCVDSSRVVEYTCSVGIEVAYVTVRGWLV